MAASPSEFLTFYRRLTVSSIARSSLSTRTAAARPFSTSFVTRATGRTDDKEHATRKGDSLDVQSREVKHGTQSKAQGTGGHATQEKDVSGSVKKAKSEHPEAPDPAIGMQDERGGKEQ